MSSSGGIAQALQTLDVYQLIGQLVNNQSIMHAKLREGRSLIQRRPMPGLVIEFDEEKGIKTPKYGIPTFSPTLSDVADTTERGGFFGMKNPMTRKDLDQLVSLHRLVNVMRKYAPAWKIPTILSNLGIVHSKIDFMSGRPDTSVPSLELIKKIASPIMGAEKAEEAPPFDMLNERFGAKND